MKKFSVIMLICVAMCFSVTSVFAMDTSFIVPFSGSSDSVQTVAFKINDDVILRTGFGVKINESSDNTYILKIGAKIMPLLGLNYELLSSGIVDDIFADFAVYISKTFETKLADNLAMGCVVGLLKVENVGEVNNISILPNITPHITYTTSMF